MRIKKVLAFALSMIMIISMLPVGVIASNETNETITVSGKFIVNNFKEGTAEYFGEMSIYSESAENDYCYRNIVFGENNTWSVEFPADYVGDYILCVMPYSYGNVFPGEYEYVDEEGVPITITLDGKNVSGIDISLPTGRLISGTIELPEDAVLPQMPVECGVYGGVNDNENNSASAGTSSGVSYDEYFANVQIKSQTTPFDLVIDDDVTSVIVSARPWSFGTDTNLLSSNVFYVDNTKSTQSVSEAVAVDSSNDVSGIKLYPATSNLLNIRMIRPETVTQNVSGTLKILDENGDEITYKYFQLYSDGYQDRNFSLAKEHEKVYIYFKASGYSSGNFCPYEDWLYYNPDGSFVTTMEEAKPHTLSGLTNIEFTVPDENFLQPKIKGKVLFEEGTIAENVVISVVVTPIDGYSGYSKEIFNNVNGNVETTPITDGREFEFVFPEGSGSETKEYTVSIDVSRYEGGKTNIFSDLEKKYYYSSDGATIVKDKATPLVPAVADNDITFNIPKMKTLSGKIVADGEYKYLNEESIARIIFRCDHEEDSSESGDVVVGGEAVVGGVATYATEVIEYTEDDCILDYYETEAIINKDLTFTCYVPDFMTGEHTTQLKIDSTGTNLLSGWYCYTDENGSEIIMLENGEPDETISFNVKTGYALSGVVKMPDSATLETNSNVQDFQANIRVQREGYTNFDEYVVTLSNTVREAPFMVAVDKDNSDECYLYAEPGYLWSYTNLNPNTLYYINNKSTTDVKNNATLLNVTGDMENLVLNLKVDGEETVEPETTETTFTVIDKHTRYPVPGASIVVTDATETASFITSTDGTASVKLVNGAYKVVVTKDGYVTKTEEIEVSDKEYKFEIEIEKIEVDIASNTTFVVKDGDLETTPVISGASLTIEDAEGNVITKSTDSDGKADADLDDGTYYVTAIANAYKTRSFKIERTDTNNNFIVYLNKDDIIIVKSSVKEMTPDEMEEAGIDTDNIGNKQVYNCTAVLSFMPHVSISYYYDSDGDIVKGKTPLTVRVDNTTITPVGKDIYLIVKSTTTWLKETFEVQIVCDNTSAVETVEDLTANLTIPEGLSLAIMTEGMENEAEAVLGDVLPKGTTSHKWYICGDKEGEYSLDGTLTGTRTGGGISEDINLTFGVEDSIAVLAGSAMQLTIDAETRGIVGEPYYMRYTLENVSGKSLYDLSFSVFGGKFFEDFGVVEVKYAKEYGPDAIEDLDGKGFVFETEEFKPGDKVQGVFEIEFGEELLLGEGQEWILKKAFVIAGNGSTTEIPVKINWEYDVPAHDWDDGVVTKAPTCTEDGTKTFTCKDEDCEETFTVIISATGHNMGEYVIVKPTCTSEGSETSKCQNDGCEHSVVLPLAKTDHSWNADFTIDTAPTCTEKGSKSRHCANCSATTDVQDVDKLGHNYGDWQTRTPATCEEAGEDYRVCANGCNIEDTKVVDKLGHDFASEWTVDVEAKCEEKGSESRHCSRCSATTDVRDIPEKGHKFGQWQVRTEATCETDGEEYRICENGCTKEETKPIGKLGHNWDDGTVTKQPTETETGNKQYTCKRCTGTKNETLPMLVKQDVGFTVPTMTYTYGDKTAVYNEAYNDSEGGSSLTYSSSNESVATVDKDGKIIIIGAGEAIITATAVANDKYLETTATFKLTIKKASLTVTAKDAEIYYGEEGKNDGFTATGFVLGETEAVIKGTPVYDVKYNKLDKTGDYEIAVSGLTADNYEIAFKPGKLTVKKAESYNIELSKLSQRKGKIEEVTASVTPKDDAAKVKVEYQFTDGVWVDTIPSDIKIGEYKVRAYVTESDNLVVGKYFEDVLEIKAGAVVNIDGNNDLSIDSNVTGDNVEFTIPDEAIEEIVNNVPDSGEIVIDATGSTGGVTNLTLPENIITALDESENVNTFTVIADDAEISMSADVLKTVADEMSAGDKVNVHIEAVEKESLNDDQKAALDAIAADAHVLQLNLEVQKQDGSTQLHELKGKVEVKAAYTLPADMNGKKIVVCYVSDNGTVTYMRATYKDGFVHFKTDHFSHYAIAAIECTHTWDEGTVITQATTSSEGLKRYECTICGETKDETIPKKSGYVGGGGGGSVTYTVTYQTNGGSEIKKVSVNKNAVLTQPKAPEKEGYKFDGWYTDKELTTVYDFDTKVTKSFTLYAKWTEIEKEPVVDEPETTVVFKDVKANDWFYANVQYVVENKLMNGVAEDKFAPNDTLTRAMLVTVLYRNAGEPATNRSIPFADVDMGAYYANAVSWAKQNGIVSGVTENEFAPDSNITREQIATILFRYAQYKGMEAITLEENLHFVDSDEISEYAVSAMNWAVGKGLIKGKSETTLNPKDNATRAEIAAILQRFIEANK